MAMNAALLQKLKDAKNKYASRGTNVFKFKEGKTHIRILTGAIGSRTDKDASEFWRDLGVHWIKQSADGKPVAVVGCTEVVSGEPCAICNAIEASGGSQTDDETLNLMKEWRARKNVLIVALIRSGSEANEETPQICELTPGTFSDICSVLETYTDEENDPLDLKTGMDLIIERTGKGKNDTKYKVMPAPKSKPVPAAALDNMPDIDAHIQKEFFRGDEPRALRAIGVITGVDTSRMIPKKAAAPMLTGASAATVAAAAIAGADVSEVVEDEDDGSIPLRVPAKAAAAQKAGAAAPVKKSAPVAEPVDLSEKEADEILSELDNLVES